MAKSKNVVSQIKKATRRRFSADEKIRIVLEGLRGEVSISELCRREGIAASIYYNLKVSVGKFDLGMTNPTVFSNPINREYQSLALNQTFESLEKVPLLWKKPAFGDCSSFPVRQGFTDILYIYIKNQTPILPGQQL